MRDQRVECFVDGKVRKVNFQRNDSFVNLKLAVPLIASNPIRDESF